MLTFRTALARVMLAGKGFTNEGEGGGDGYDEIEDGVDVSSAVGPLAVYI